MPGSRLYDVMYRAGLARRFWSRVDRWEIRDLVEGGPGDPKNLAPPTGGPPRAIDLGCGEGGVSIYLAKQGFDTVGVDFSGAALTLARGAAARAGLDGSSIHFVQGDLTASMIPGVEGPFDLLVDYGTLDDLGGDARLRAARLISSLARPGSRFFLYAFYARLRDLPWISFSGPSRLAPERIEPGELETLFDDSWAIERIPREGGGFVATFLLTRRHPATASP
jgi:SAM-dependent methyltransferase